MPLLIPKVSGTTYESNVSGRPTTTSGTALTSHASSAHTLPTDATEIIASTTYDAWWVEIIFHNNYVANTRTDSLVNIYTGAAGSEVVLIPNLLAGWAIPWDLIGVSKVYRFPLHVPAGTRLSGRHQSARTNTPVYCVIRLFGGAGYSNWCGTGVECVGAVTGSSSGTSVTAGGASEGTLTSIGTNTYEWGHVQPVLGGNVTDTTMNAGIIAADLASGSSTSNLIPGLEEFLFKTATAEYCGPAAAGGRFARVPSSTTLYLRAQTSATEEAQDWCIYGCF